MVSKSRKDGIPHDLFQFIVNCDCKQLYNLYHREIRQNLFRPIYNNLQYINLAQSHLSNIQSLVGLDAPHLQVIDLQGNNLCRLNCLNKWRFTKLKKLVLMYNKLSEISISRMDSQSGKVDFLFGYCNSSYKKTQRKVYDMTFYVNLKANNFNPQMKNQLLFSTYSTKFTDQEYQYGSILRKMQKNQQNLTKVSE